MSLVRFKITNHPQQVRKRGARVNVDERITPKDIYWAFNRRFGFTLDAAASAGNAKCPIFYDIEADGLNQSWRGFRVWCNPPYSNIPAWIEKALYEFREGGCDLIVMLLPANRTEQRWWQQSVEPFRDKSGGWMRTEFLASRINFGVPGNENSKWHSSAPFGCVAIILSEDQDCLR